MLVQNVCFPGPLHSVFMNFKSSNNREDLEGYARWGNSYLDFVPLGFVNSCVSYICSGFQLTDTPRSGAEEGKERPERQPLAFKYNLQNGTHQNKVFRHLCFKAFESKNIQYLAKLSKDVYVRCLNCRAWNRKTTPERQRSPQGWEEHAGSPSGEGLLLKSKQVPCRWSRAATQGSMCTWWKRRVSLMLNSGVRWLEWMSL